jgi:hypothetical protein
LGDDEADRARDLPRRGQKFRPQLVGWAWLLRELNEVVWRHGRLRAVGARKLVLRQELAQALDDADARDLAVSGLAFAFEQVA